MTDIMKLAEALFTRIEWQSVNDPVTIEDMTGYIVEAIKTLYVMTGRAMLFSDDLIIDRGGICLQGDASFGRTGICSGNGTG